MASCLLVLTGIDVARAQQPNPAVDRIFSDLSTPGSPGCALGVYRNDKIVYEKGYGLADLEENVPITPQSVFDVGSVSKQFTAASILLLEKQGRLRLDDDVRKYIPELPDYSPQSGQKITLLHLLNHTGGLRDYVALFLLAGIHPDNVTTNDDALTIIARQKSLNFPSGTNWQYSSSGYLLLSLVVERVSRKNLREFADENIFRPLGMTHTGWRNDHTSLILHRVLGYDRSEKGDFTLGVSYAEQTGDGMLHTSIEDIQKWDENFYSGQVGGKDFAANMERPARLGDGSAVGYSQGLFIDTYRGLPIVWHPGASAGYRAHLLRFPQQHFSVVCLCNVSNARPWRRSEDVAIAYLSDLMKPKENTGSDLTLEQLQVLAGVYRNPRNGDVLRIAVADGKLRADFGDGMLDLYAITPTLFHLIDYGPFETSLKFERAHNAAPYHIIVNANRALPATFQIVDDTKPQSLSFDIYAGDFWSNELHVTYRLASRNGTLWLKELIGGDGLIHTGIIPFNKMTWVLPDEFYLSGANLIFRFTRGKDGNVTGFALNGFHERGIVFTRLSNTK